ncbi:MAG TPA: hypothetical protein VGK01_04690 [Candidatus Angelobacter sp.]|jgi:hypothetical protein
MKTSIFLSYPTPHLAAQMAFVNRFRLLLVSRDFELQTLGVSEMCITKPLVSIRRMIQSTSGIVIIALRRTLVSAGKIRALVDIHGLQETDLDSVWWTSPYCQIEAAMAYQEGIPILICREKGVISEGMLEEDAAGVYLPEFDSASPGAFFDTFAFNNGIRQWEILVNHHNKAMSKTSEI